jgi:hypothetical protein
VLAAPQASAQLESSGPQLMTSLGAPVSGRGFLLAADRPISNLTATEVKRLGVSNGGSELGDFFLCRYRELNLWYCNSWFLPSADCELRCQIDERNGANRI